MSQDNKHLLELSFDYTLSGLALLTPEFTFIRVNQAYAQADQREVSDFPGRNYFDLYPSAENRAVFEDVVRSKQPYCAVGRLFEQSAHLKRGVTYWDWSLVPMLAKNGDVEYLLFSLNDVTERVRTTQKALHESEERSQAMLNAIPDMMFRMDSHGVFLDYQAETGDLYHQSETGIIGKRCRDIMPPELVDVIEEKITQTLASSVALTFEYQLDLPLRGVRDYEARMVPCGTAEVLAIVRDITDRKQADEKLRKSEGKYRELVEHANNIILHWTSDGRITFMNEYGQRFFGFSETEIIGRHVVGTIVPETESTGRDLRLLLDQISADPGAFEYNINENIRKNGERVWLAWTNKVAFDDQNRIIGILSIATDITEIKKAEEAITASEARLRGIGDATPDLTMLIDEEGRYIEILTAESNLLYKSAEYLVGKTIQEVFPSGQSAQFMDIIKRTIDSGSVQSIEYALDLEQGPTWFEGRAAPLSISHAGKRMVVFLARDITERRNAEKALQESEANLHTFFDTIDDFLFVLDENGAIQLANRTVQERLGYSEAELIGRNVLQVHPPDRHEEALHIISEMLAGKREYCPIPLQAADGRQIPVETRVVPGTWNGRPALFGVCRDITERRRNEAERDEALALFQAVVNAAPVRIFWKDRDSRYLGCNPLFARDSGKSGPDDLIGKDDHEMGWAEQAGLYQADDRLVMETGASRLNFEEPQSTPDGRTICLRTSKVPLRNRRGEIIGVLGLYDDITEQKLAMEKVNAQFNELRRWQEVMLNREERIIHLKREVNELLTRLQEPPRYDNCRGEET